jgi:hypothetical protein
MPPPIVKTIEDLIYWEYAKLVAGSAVHDRQNRAFEMHIFLQLRKGEKHMSDVVREDKLLVESYANQCAYCGKKNNLEWEHIIPRARAVDDAMVTIIDSGDNLVRACKHCNASKGDRDPYEWYISLYGEKEGKYKIPRIVWGKYLKLMHGLHEKAGTLHRPCATTIEINCILR